MTIECAGCHEEFPREQITVLRRGGPVLRTEWNVCGTCEEFAMEHGRLPGESCTKCGAEEPLNVVGHCRTCVMAKF